jgi:DNA primase
MLCIPYIRYSQEYGWTVVKLRFRKLAWNNRADDSSKYLDMPGSPTRMYNTMALLRNTLDIAITEGEIDAITAELCGIPTVGIPGATNWKKHFREPFLGYRAVFILADGDEPGAKFAHGVAKALPNAKVIPSPDGEDVNSLVVKHGPAALLERLR